MGTCCAKPAATAVDASEARDGGRVSILEAARGARSGGGMGGALKSDGLGDMRRAHMKSLVAAEALHDVGFARATSSRSVRVGRLKAGGFTAEEMRDMGLRTRSLGAGHGLPSSRRASRAGAARASRGGARRWPPPRSCVPGYAPRSCARRRRRAEPRRRITVRGAAHRRLWRRSTKSKAFTRGRCATQGTARSSGGWLQCASEAAGYDAWRRRAPATASRPQGGGPSRSSRGRRDTAPAMRAAGFELDASVGGLPGGPAGRGLRRGRAQENGSASSSSRWRTRPATLREAGYKADRLKLQGYTAAELAQGGYTAKELRGFKDRCTQTTRRRGTPATRPKSCARARCNRRRAQGGWLHGDRAARGRVDGGGAAPKGYSCLSSRRRVHGEELLGGRLLGAELRDVGHSAAALRAIEITAQELRRRLPGPELARAVSSHRARAAG